MQNEQIVTANRRSRSSEQIAGHMQNVGTSTESRAPDPRFGHAARADREQLVRADREQIVQPVDGAKHGCGLRGWDMGRGTRTRSVRLSLRVALSKH